MLNYVSPFNSLQRNTSNAVGDSAAEIGTESNMKSMAKEEPGPQSSNLVFGYLNLISDGVVCVP